MAVKQSETLLSKFVVNNFQRFGFWPKPLSSSSRYWLYSYIFNTILSTLLACLIINLILLDDINHITDSLVSTLTVAAYFLKALNFYYHRDGMKKCLNNLALFEHKTSEEIALTLSKQKLLNIFGFGYFIGGYLTIFALCFIPLSESERVNPLPVWYPFEWKLNIVIYGIGYAHQIILITLILTINVSFDCYSFFVMGMVAVQFRIIGIRLQNLGSKTSLNSDLGPTHNYSKLLKQSVQDLRHCISVYQDILR